MKKNLVITGLLFLSIIPLYQGCTPPIDHDKVPSVKGKNMAQNAELSWLAGKWVDKEKPQYFLDFSADGKTYLIGRSGQVGSAGDPDLPYPTSCCYEFVSRDFDLIVKKEKNPKTGTEYTGYYLNYQYSEVRLVPNCDNSANCHKYIERANAREEVGWVHTLEFVRFEDSIITNDGHTYYK